MSNLWIPMLLGLSNGFGGFNTYLSSGFYISSISKYSNRYERYGVDK